MKSRKLHRRIGSVSLSNLLVWWSSLDRLHSGVKNLNFLEGLGVAPSFKVSFLLADIFKEINIHFQTEERCQCLVALYVAHWIYNENFLLIDLHFGIGETYFMLHSLW